MSLVALVSSIYYSLASVRNHIMAPTPKTRAAMLAMKKESAAGTRPKAGGAAQYSRRQEPSPMDHQEANINMQFFLEYAAQGYTSELPSSLQIRTKYNPKARFKEPRQAPRQVHGMDGAPTKQRSIRASIHFDDEDVSSWKTGVQAPQSHDNMDSWLVSALPDGFDTAFDDDPQLLDIQGCTLATTQSAGEFKMNPDNEYSVVRMLMKTHSDEKVSVLRGNHQNWMGLELVGCHDDWNSDNRFLDNSFSSELPSALDGAVLFNLLYKSNPIGVIDSSDALANLAIRDVDSHSIFYQVENVQYNPILSEGQLLEVLLFTVSGFTFL